MAADSIGHADLAVSVTARAKDLPVRLHSTGAELTPSNKDGRLYFENLSLHYHEALIIEGYFASIS